jgi:hypothetical protein
MINGNDAEHGVEGRTQVTGGKSQAKEKEFFKGPATEGLKRGFIVHRRGGDPVRRWDRY